MKQNWILKIKENRKSICELGRKASIFFVKKKEEKQTRLC